MARYIEDRSRLPINTAVGYLEDRRSMEVTRIASFEQRLEDAGPLTSFVLNLRISRESTKLAQTESTIAALTNLQ